jgi:FkbM family methyltransferase
MNDLARKLTEIEQLAQGSRWRRLWHTPGKYLFALGFRELVYARNRRAQAADVTTFFGLPMRVMLPAGTDLYLLGAKSHESETRLARVMMRYLKPNDTFADVGGHFGYFSLLASQLVGPGGRVVAFEASRNTYAVLAHNVRTQANIEAFHQALSDRSETISFFEFPVMYNEFNSMNVDQFRAEKWFAKYPPVKTEVAATTLDEAMIRLGATPACIKIDVEGAELKVIRGAARTLQAQRPLLVMEYLAPGRHNTAHHEAAALLREWGYVSHAPLADGQLEPCADLDDYLVRRNEDSTNFFFVKK